MLSSNRRAISCASACVWIAKSRPPLEKPPCAQPSLKG
jgi:hypothetical protein